MFIRVILPALFALPLVASANNIIISKEVRTGETADRLFAELLLDRNVEEYTSIDGDAVRRVTRPVVSADGEWSDSEISCARQARRCTLTETRYERDEW